jgi:hypothetical protein
MIKSEAFQRLLGRWLDELARDPQTAHRLPLRDVVTAENVAAVIVLDLYPEYSPAQRRRDFDLLTAWMAPRPEGRPTH